jgi:predicted amidohydrolase
MRGDDSQRGCPVCDRRGELAQTYDRTHTYHTHVIIRDGEIFSGDTGSKRRQPRDLGPFTRLWRWVDG